jgi:hypothetical protein
MANITIVVRLKCCKVEMLLLPGFNILNGVFTQIAIGFDIKKERAASKTYNPLTFIVFLNLN